MQLYSKDMHCFACKAVLLTAGGVHRNVDLSKDTEVQLYSKDVAKANDDVCQKCYDSECNVAEVSSPISPCSLSTVSLR